MKSSTNFIRHFLDWVDLASCDERLTPHHISLYLALFNSWNLNHFENPISICREEIMKIAKIGSVNTYTRCLKELDSWNYLCYKPSYNAVRGSKVHMYSFDKGCDKAGVLPTIKPVRPSLNNTNNTKPIDCGEPLSKVIKANTEENDDAKLQRKDNNFTPPREAEVVDFFQSQLNEKKELLISNENATREAQKFFNYFASVGWKVGRTKTMKNWKAAATNWILNSQKFKHQLLYAEKKPFSHHAQTDKNYGEPL